MEKEPCLQSFLLVTITDRSVRCGWDQLQNLTEVSFIGRELIFSTSPFSCLFSKFGRSPAVIWNLNLMYPETWREMLLDGTCPAGLKHGVYMTVSITTQNCSVWNGKISVSVAVVKHFYSTKSDIPSFYLQLELLKLLIPSDFYYFNLRYNRQEQLHWGIHTLTFHQTHFLPSHCQLHTPC